MQLSQHPAGRARTDPQVIGRDAHGMTMGIVVGDTRGWWSAYTDALWTTGAEHTCMHPCHESLQAVLRAAAEEAERTSDT